MENGFKLTKVLLCSVFKPFGVENEIDGKRILPELFEAQVTFAQGMFSLRSVYLAWGLDLIACNLSTPTTVMHYPSLKEFKKELKNNYDYVGISFVTPTFEKAKIMAKLVRKLAPKSKLIFGGYGTVHPEVDQIADYVCREEGIGFMRKLLRETDHPKATIMPIFKTRLEMMGLHISDGALVLLGLGCPNGCDFCCTSHFFNRKRIPFIYDAKTLYEELLRIEKKTGVTGFGVIDEDFLLQKELLTDLANYTKERREKPFRFSCFGSAKALSMYTPEELVKLGIETVWVGVESKKSHFEKLKSIDVKSLLSGLNDVGINFLGSFILGLEHHNEENLKEDFEEFISMKPTLSQFLISTPVPGTPLHARLKAEGKLFHDSPYNLSDGFSLIFNHPNFSPKRLSELQMRFFKEEYNRLGPSAFRNAEVQFRGYLNLKDSTDPVLHARAHKVYKKTCRAIYPLFAAGIRFAPNRDIRKKLKIFAKALYKEFGKPKISEKIKAMAVMVAAHVYWFRSRVERPNNPKTIVNHYRLNKKHLKESRLSMRYTVENAI